MNATGKAGWRWKKMSIKHARMIACWKLEIIVLVLVLAHEFPEYETFKCSEFNFFISELRSSTLIR